MNEILYADCDTNHFKMLSDKVWVLAQQPITLSSGSAKQTSLPAALRSAVQFKNRNLKSTRQIIRFVQIGPNRPKMVQKTAQQSQPSSLSKAIQKALLIKKGRCQKSVGSKTIEGTMVWSLTPEPVPKPKITRLNSFLSGLKRLKMENALLTNRVMETAPLQFDTQEKLVPVPVSVCNSFQAVPMSA